MVSKCFKSIYRFLTLVMICVMSNSGTVLADQNPNLELKEALKIAVDDNPNLAQMLARYRAFSEIPSQVGSLPDPTINLNAMNLPTNTFSTSQEPMTQMQIGLSQAFPFPGKLSLKKEAARYEAAAANNDAEEVRLQLTKQVKISWWQVYFLDRSLEIIDKNQNLLRQFIKIAQTKYKVGKGLQQDVLLAQLELSKLLDHKIQLNSLRINQVAKLNALMGKGANSAIKLPEKVDIKLPKILSEKVLFEEARFSKPTLIKNRNLVKASRSRQKLADKEYYPDFKVGVNYGNRSGNNAIAAGGGRRGDFASVMLTMTIPLYAETKQTRGVYQRKYELSQSEFAKQDTYNSILSDITQGSSEYNRARDQFTLFKTGILPQARQTVNSMLSGYKVSQVDFLNLVRSQLTLFSYEVKYWKALVEAKQALASLESFVGKEVLHVTNYAKPIKSSEEIKSNKLKKGKNDNK